MNSKQLFTRTVAGAALLLLSSLVSAGIIVTPGNIPGGVDNVLENPCDPHITGPALTIQGCLNTDQAFLVDFTSDENIKYAAGGQAKIVADDGAFSFLKVALDIPGWTFSKLILNIEANADGFVTFTGAPGGSQQLALSKNGNNFFTITGEDFSSVSFATTVGVASIDLASDVKQVRIGGFEQLPPTTGEQPPGVPEPGVLSLLGLAFVGLGSMRRYRLA